MPRAAPESIRNPPARLRADPGPACQRFARLPTVARLQVFDTLTGLHGVPAGLGWVTCARRRLHPGRLVWHFTTRLTGDAGHFD